MKCRIENVEATVPFNFSASFFISGLNCYKNLTKLNVLFAWVNKDN